MDSPLLEAARSLTSQGMRHTLAVTTTSGAKAHVLIACIACIGQDYSFGGQSKIVLASGKEIHCSADADSLADELNALLNVRHLAAVSADDGDKADQDDSPPRRKHL